MFSGASAARRTSTICSFSTTCRHQSPPTLLVCHWTSLRVAKLGVVCADLLVVDFTGKDVDGTQPVDPNQLMDTYVAQPISEPSYILGNKPGVSSHLPGPTWNVR